LKFIETLREYEEFVGEKLQLRSTVKANLESFIDYLETEDYQTSTIERNIGRLRFFLNRAVEMNMDVNLGYKERIIFDFDTDIEGVYLHPTEIKKIVDTDFSDNEELFIAKQNFLLGLFTGLRISDFLKLDTSNISDGNITIKAKKTKTKVVIPVHPIVADIIAENFGFLPKKMNASDFNVHIKTICQVCEIDNMVYGKVFDKELKRKKVGYFEKYKLISSHVCRKSFATNFSGAGKDVLNSVLGWSKNSNMSNHYNKKSHVELAEIMKKQWNQ
jgi:integrase